LSAALRISGLSAGYDGESVLHDLTLEVPADACVGIIGPNGAGKTTLLRAAAGLLRPAAGTVEVFGEPLNGQSARSRAQCVALVAQRSPVAFEFRAGEVVLMGRAPRLGPLGLEGARDRERAAWAMARTQCAALAARPMTTLSGGEAQRVLLARALAQEPRLLLLDEPTTHLDIQHQIEVLDLVRSLCAEDDLTVLIVLHDLNLASQFCDRLLLLHRGRLVEDGPPERVITEANLAATYGAAVHVRLHPTTGRPYVTLPGPAAPRSAASGVRLHVIAGAGAGSALLHRLVQAGHAVSVGVLNVADSDQELAQEMGLARVEEAPFCAISAERSAENVALARAAAAVIVAPVLWGLGNLSNLDAAETALAAGVPVLVLTEPPVAARDYTGGEAVRRIEGLLAHGAQRAANTDAALAWVARLLR